MNLRWSKSDNRFEAEDFNIDQDGDALLVAGFCCESSSLGTIWYSEKAESLSNLRKNRPPSGLTITAEARAQYLSRATISDLYIPSPEGCVYLPYQKAAVEYARLHPSTGIFDEPGLGKSVEAVAISNDDSSLRKILIICPAFLKPNWRKEWLKWDVKGLTVGIAEGIKGEFPQTDVVIINFDILKAYRSQLRAREWDLMIADEIHKIKSKKADRTREVFGGIKRDGNKKIIDRTTAIPARRKVYMTGTPSLNGKPKELWPLLQSIDPNDLGRDWFAFAKRYCQLTQITRWDFQLNNQVHQGWLWDGRDNLEELQYRMRQNFMIRRLKADVLKDLPAKRRVVIPIQPGKREAKALAKELEEFKNYAKGREGALLEMPAFGDFSKKMLETGLRMVEPCTELVESDLEENESLLVACYHKEVAEKIHAGLNNFALITGDVPPSQRLEIVERFQNGEFDGIVGTIGSMGVGLTATRASLMIFPERSWVPGDVTQMEDRIHRIGQSRNVLYKHLVLEGSLSEYQVHTMVDKQDAADRMVG